MGVGIIHGTLRVRLDILYMFNVVNRIALGTILIEELIRLFSHRIVEDIFSFGSNPVVVYIAPFAGCKLTDVFRRENQKRLGTDDATQSAEVLFACCSPPIPKQNPLAVLAEPRSLLWSVVFFSVLP